MNSAYEFMQHIAQRGLAQQSKGELDFVNEDGLLVCGVCGEPRQCFIPVPDAESNDLRQCREVKAVRQCKCERDREEAERRQHQAQQDMIALERLRSASLMDERFSKSTFEQFETNKYNERNLKICRRYVDKFDLMLEKNQGLLFWGGVGTGKTFAAACIANALLSRMVPVVMTSFVRLIDLIQRGNESDVAIINRINRAKLVVFDDLGAERSTEYALEKVYSIVDERYRKKLPSIFTTNLSLADMEADSDVRYARIYDRILESCYPMQFTGVSWRKREAGHRFEAMEDLINAE